MIELAIYADEAGLTKLDKLDFGRIETGTSKELTVYLKNNTRHDAKDVKLTLKPSSNTEVINPPGQVMRQTAERITIRWSPPLALRAGLKADLEIAYTLEID